MPSSTEQFVITIPLSRADRAKAEAAASHRTSAEQQSAYRNALAVLATHYYLRMIEIPTEVENSACFDPGNLTDTADLFVPMSHGRLECRPVQAGEDKGYVPPSVWSDRIGYVFVQLDDTGLEANILGFVSQVSGEQLPLSYLRSLDDLIDRLYLPSVTDLAAWLRDQFESAWNSCKGLLRPRLPIVKMAKIREVDTLNLTPEAIQEQINQLYHQAKIKQPELSSFQISTDHQKALANLLEAVQDDATRWKAAELLFIINPEHPSSPKMRSKGLGIYLANQDLVLTVGVVQKPNDQLLILLKVTPEENTAYLPNNLILTVLTHEGIPSISKKSGQFYDFIELLITADPGDSFNVNITLGDSSIVESFSV